MPTLTFADLRDFARRLFEAGGVPADEAAVVAAGLAGSNLCGHDSHGVIRVPQYLELIRSWQWRPGSPLAALSETPALLAADGNWGLGQVQAHRLLDRLVPKARELGVALGTLRNCGHTGRLGEYAERAAADGLALFATVNSHGHGRRVAPPGGAEARLSTNPLCLGVPTAGDPLVLDISTSAAAEGKVRVAFQKGEAVPDGWLTDSAGRPTTDPAALYADPPGALAPFGGAQAYKGFGLGLLLDVLAGGPSGGTCTLPTGRGPVGNCVVFALFDPAKAGGLDHLVAEAVRLADYVRGCPPAAGGAAVTLPGDPERLARRQRSAEGIPVADGTWRRLCEVARPLGVAVPDV